jgi:hypothetical protein
MATDGAYLGLSEQHVANLFDVALSDEQLERLGLL